MPFLEDFAQAESFCLQSCRNTNMSQTSGHSLLFYIAYVLYNIYLFKILKCL